MATLFCMLLALLPASYFAVIALFVQLDPSDTVLFGFFLAYGVVGAVLAIGYAVTARSASARCNLAVKLAALPFDIAALILVIVRIIETNQAAADGAMGGGLGIALLLLFAMPYLLVRALMLLAGAIACSRITTQQRHVLLHLFPLTDLLDACILLRH